MALNASTLAISSSMPPGMENLICPPSPNPSASEFAAYQADFTQHELGKLGKLGRRLSPGACVERAAQLLQQQHGKMKRKPVPQKPSASPERVEIYNDIRIPLWCSIEKVARQIRDLMDSDKRKFHGKVDFDMRCFHDQVKRDEHVPNKALKGKNMALRWNIVRLIWEIIRDDILFETDEIIEKDVLAWQTVKHIKRSLRPFTNKNADDEAFSSHLFHVASLATTLKRMLSSDTAAYYSFKLPPNAKGSCIGNETAEHIEMMNLHDENHEEKRKIYGIMFGPLIRTPRGPNGPSGPLVVVECPAWAVEYGLGDY